jgi:hypothetical protein
MSKQFAYCIGGCRTVPSYLDCLTTDNADCFPVFFKEPGPAGSIFLPNSTTNTGRNAAYEQARKGDYEYIIIMDDDVSFAGLTHEQGFRKFEALINEFKPAIATPRYYWHLGGNTRHSEVDLSKRIQGCSATDACINAFHRSTWPALLPYWCEGDSESWWNAAHVLHRVARYLWPGGFIQFNELELLNEIRHGNQYPKHGGCTAADNLLLSMLKPEFRLTYEMWLSKESLKALDPRLNHEPEEAGKFFNLEHPYWRGRLPT